MRVSLCGLVTGVTGDDRAPPEKRGGVFIGEIGKGDRVTAFSAPFTRARSRRYFFYIFSRARKRYRKCCHPVTTLTSILTDNVLSVLIGKRVSVTACHRKAFYE